MSRTSSRRTVHTLASEEDFIAIINGVSYRSKDLDKIDIPWEKRAVVHDFGDGWTIERVETRNDLEIEGGILNHCASDHFHRISAGEELILSLRNPNGVSKATFHAYPLACWGNDPMYQYGEADEHPQFHVDGVPMVLVSITCRRGASEDEYRARCWDYLHDLGVEDAEVTGQSGNNGWYY